MTPRPGRAMFHAAVCSILCCVHWILKKKKTTLGQNSEVGGSPVAKIWEDSTRK